MPGYMIALGPCICCRRVFHFNPARVPSTTAINGEREPVCASCMQRINERRATIGLPPFEILPDAYEACAEGEL